MPIIELHGAGPHPWPSVERTRRFYLRALEESFELRHASDPATKAPDASLHFSGGASWRVDAHPDWPLVLAMHGGPILDHDMLQNSIGKLETSDVLLVNCLSDMRILAAMVNGEGPLLRHLPLPVDTSVFHRQDKAKARDLLPLHPTDHVVGFVGRLLPQKNLHGFLRMFAEVKRRIAPRTACAVVIGNYWVDYPVLPYVTADYPNIISKLLGSLRIADDVIYLPANLSNDDLATAYNAMDVLVHPTTSIDENFGYAPVEAMACGVPVVGAAYGGLKDTIGDGETGFLVDTWITDSGIRLDVARAIAATQRLLEDASLAARCGAAGVERMRARYSVETCGEALRSAVRDGVEMRWSGRSRPVVTATPRIPHPEAGLLPRVPNEPWEHYRDVVAHYVSGPAPRIAEAASIRLAAPLEQEADTRFRLLDPAWPARFELDGTARAIVDHLVAGGTLESLRAGQLGSDEALQAMLESGLLIASRTEPSNA